MLDAGKSESDAKQAILDQWTQSSKVASREGTLMHEHAEYVCNGIELPDPSPEMVMLMRWMKEFQPHMQWEPVRTEWMLWWELAHNDCTSPAILAGTLDLLMWSKTADVYGLFDFKRTNPKPKFKNADPNLLGPHTHPMYHPGYAKSPPGSRTVTTSTPCSSTSSPRCYGKDTASTSQTTCSSCRYTRHVRRALCTSLQSEGGYGQLAVEEERTRRAALRPPPPTPSR